MFQNERYSFCRELGCGAYLSLAALGPGLFTGRETAFFYAQTGRISWLGIVLCALMFGVFTGTTAHFARKTGAINFPQIFRRSMGVYAGGCIWTLHLLCLAAAGWFAMIGLMRAGAMMLPLGHAGWIGLGIGIFAVFLLARKKPGRTEIFFGCIALVFLLMLLIRGRMPAEAERYMRIRLKIDGSGKAMLALALLHGCRCAAVTAGAAAGFGRQMRPLHLGAAAGGWTAVLLGLSNGVLRRWPERLMALKEPFAGMCGEWGKEVHLLVSGMMWLGAVMMLACAGFSLQRILFREWKNGC